MNNGTEDCKGTSLQIETGKRLRVNNEINFIGNVEFSAVMTGVCDGSTGNVFLKATEGMGKQILSSLKNIHGKCRFKVIISYDSQQNHKVKKAF